MISAVETCSPVVCGREHELLPMDVSDVWCKCPGAYPHASAGCKCVDACVGRAAVICQPVRMRTLVTSASRTIHSLFTENGEEVSFFLFILQFLWQVSAILNGQAMECHSHQQFN